MVGMEDDGFRAVGWIAVEGMACAGRNEVVLLEWVGDDLDGVVEVLYFVLITGRGRSIWRGSSGISGV